ncbi:MAG: helix-hairpin-helix domain-containing protein [Tabrizicola sp.]|jgi:hypothetical protein|nr:helix-hairpin-helix domain-containing protein [Tabrizicola sp.]
MPQDCQDRISRPVFFDRQSLTSADLNAVIDYVSARSRRHNRAVVGHGVTCGLSVQKVPGQPWHLQVGTGHAVLPSGEEVSVPIGTAALDICAEAQACLGIAEGCVAPHELTSGPSPVSGEIRVANSGETFRSLDFTGSAMGASYPSPIVFPWISIAGINSNFTPAQQIRVRSIGAINGLAVAPMLAIDLATPTNMVEVRVAHSGSRPIVVAMAASGAELDRQSPTSVAGVASTLRLQGQAIRRIVISDFSSTAALLGIALPATARGEVHLALYAAETAARFQPAMPDRCGPPGNDLMPTRICEDFRLAVLCALPPALALPDCTTVNRIICGPDHLPCPPDPLPNEDCVILATIRCGDFGILSVDEFTHRRRLLPNWLLSAAEACECIIPPPSAPPPTPTPPPTSTPTPTPTPPPTPTPTPPPTPTPTPQPTQFTFEPTFFTRITLEPSVFTQFSLFTNQPTFPTRPTFFTGPTFGPGGPTFGPGGPTFGPGGPGGPGGPFGPDPLGPVEDVVFPVNMIEGIGPVLGNRLRDDGISTVEEFLERDTVELSRVMGVSEVRVADFQRRARILTGREGPV